MDNNSEMKNTIYDSKKEEAFYKEQNEKEKKKLLEEIYNKDKMQNKTIEELIKDENKRRALILEKAACVKMPKCYFMAKPLLYDSIVKEYSVKHKYIPKEEDIHLFQNQKKIITQRQFTNNSEDVDKFYKLINTPTHRLSRFGGLFYLL